uniref:Uncharacterized protein n=1 Tax=Arundo donax TaxID=35708 RepID=A0A0A8ZXL5_ARUDO
MMDRLFLHCQNKILISKLACAFPLSLKLLDMMHIGFVAVLWALGGT